MARAERDTPPYLQIASHIREQILSGELKDGAAVPSARQIVRDWNVAIATAAKVLTTLKADGLVEAVSGVGTVVRSGNAHPYAGDRSMSVVRTGRIYPAGHRARIGSAELVAAPERVADALGIDAGAPVVRRARTTYDGDDVAVAASVSWFDGAVLAKAPRLLDAERIVQGTFAYVAEQTGRSVVREHTVLAASSADSADAAGLGVAEGSAVLLSRSRFFDAVGEVIEYGESTALPQRWVYVESSAAKGEE